MWFAYFIIIILSLSLLLLLISSNINYYVYEIFKNNLYILSVVFISLTK